MTTRSSDLKTIISGCRMNDPNCQKQLYVHFYGYAMSICLRYSTNHQDAEEVLNNAFLKIFQQIDKYQNDLSFRPWLRKILINTAIDHYRLNHNKQRMLVSLSEFNLELEDKSISPNPEDEDMLPIVQQLPPAYRIVFNLYVMDGYKHREIAEILSINIATSKSNLSRAKELLRKIILKNPIKYKEYVQG